MSAILAPYLPLAPEILLALAALLIMTLGVFGDDDDGKGEAMSWLAILALAGAAALILFFPVPSQALFDRSFIVDGFGRFMKLLVIAGSAFAIVMSIDYLRAARAMRFEFPVLVLLATVGMMMMISAGDLIALYIGLELQSLALYVLAAIRRDDVRSSEAGMKYFVLGALSSGMLLYGASLLYGFTGATSFQAIAAAAKAATGPASTGLLVGLAFLLVGLAFKVSAVPFHMWTPDVYEGSPTPVTAFFAAAPKVAAMALLVRTVSTAFPGIAPQWQQIVIFLSIASMVLGSLAAIGQTNIKRLLAYSSIGHVGFALVGLAAAGNDATRVEGIQGVLVYMAIYLVMTLGSFACILSLRRDGKQIEEIAELGGLAKTNLWLAFVLGALMFSLAGIPPLAGFWAKWYVFLAAVKAGLWPLAIIGVVASVIGAYYYLTIVKVMFFDETKPAFLPIQGKAGLVLALSAAFVILYIVQPAPLVDAAAAAAASLK
jgi:NADH-quinone oxidoreductase subunit N